MKGKRKMARSTTKKTNETKNNTPAFECFNVVVIRGTIKRVLLDGEKMKKYSIDVPSVTPKGNTSHTFLNVTEFSTDGAWEEGTLIHVEGHLSTGSYEKNGKKLYTTDIIADKIEEVEG